MGSKLERILSQEHVEDDYKPAIKKKNPISNVYITRVALEKAQAYARLACKIFGQSLECYGYLISPKDCKDRVVRDIYFAPNQVVSAADVKISGEDVIDAGREIDKMGYKVLGWWHSHADFGTFHSGTDDENMDRVLNEIAPTNYVKTNRSLELMAGDLKLRRRGESIEIVDAKNQGKKLRIKLDPSYSNALGMGAIKGVSIEMPIKVGFAYSVVVNANWDKPYCEIATRDYCSLCRCGDEKKEESRLRFVDEYSCIIDEKKIKKDIRKKIIIPKVEPLFPIMEGAVFDEKTIQYEPITEFDADEGWMKDGKKES